MDSAWRSPDAVRLLKADAVADGLAGGFRLKIASVAAPIFTQPGQGTAAARAAERASAAQNAAAARRRRLSAKLTDSQARCLETLEELTRAAKQLDDDEQVDVKVKLEVTKTTLESQLYLAKRAGLLITAAAAAAASGRERTMLSCLAEAGRRCGETSRRLAAECPKWPSAKRTTDDSARAWNLAAEGRACFDKLEDWIEYAQEFADTERKKAAGPAARDAAESARLRPRPRAIA